MSEMSHLGSFFLILNDKNEKFATLHFYIFIGKQQVFLDEISFFFLL